MVQHFRRSRPVLLATLLMVVAALWLARSVFIPFALALLLSFLLAPLVTLVQRTGLGRVPAVVIVVVFSFAVILGLGWLVTVQVADLATKLPDYRENIVTKARALRASVGGVGKASKTVEDLTHAITATTTQAATAESNTPVAAAPALPPPPGPPDPQSFLARPSPVDVRIVGYEQGLRQTLRAVLGPLLSPLGTAAIVIVWVIFMLIQREDLRDRLIRLVGHGQITLTTEALSEASRRVSHYLIIQVILNGTHGVVIGAGLALIGVPNALLWGLNSAVFRFIPYVGPWVAALLPVTLSLAVFDSWTRPLMVMGWLAFVELVSNNVFEPWLYGTRTGASPMAILVSAVFWTWLWGPIGLVLATPLTVCLVVLGKYVPQLEFLSVMLGDQPVLQPHVHFYQRLVALDELEAAEVVDESIESMSLVEFYDDIVIPALRQMERDRHQGVLSEERSTFVLRNIEEIIDELRGRFELPEIPEGGPAPPAVPDLPCTLVVPAADEADELVGQMFGQVLELEGHRVRVLSSHVLAAELLAAVKGENADVVCISALPPSTVAQARYLCKRLHREYPELELVVGLWTSRLKSEVAEQRIACGGSVRVGTSLKQAALLVPRRIVTPLPKPAHAPPVKSASPK